MSTEMKKDARYLLDCWKEGFVEKFDTLWFASVMGTGISGCILYKFPYEADWLKILGIIYFAIAVVLFVLHNVFFVCKNFVFYRDWTFITDVKKSVFLGCYPMGLCPILNMIVYLVQDYDLTSNSHWVNFAYVFFWFIVVLCVSCAWGVTFIIFWKSKIHDYDSHGINATLLLPLVTMTVASSTGSVLYDILPEHLKLFQLILCFMLWANTMALAFPFITIYFAKLYVTKLPPKNLIFTTFIPLGVLGQGSYGILLFGNCCKEYFLQNFNADTATTLSLIAETVSVLVALFLLSFGYFMTFLAASSALSCGFHKKFFKGFWAMTFPLGTMSVGDTKLGQLYDLGFFKVLGSIYGVAAVLITTVCLLGSLFEEFPNHCHAPQRACTVEYSDQSGDDVSTVV